MECIDRCHLKIAQYRKGVLFDFVKSHFLKVMILFSEKLKSISNHTLTFMVHLQLFSHAQIYPSQVFYMFENDDL